MKIPGSDRDFIAIGENVHTTRVLMRKGKLVVERSDGRPAVRFYDTARKRRFLDIPEAVQKTQDYEEGRVKHVKIAVGQAMDDDQTALAYLERLVQRQVDAGADYLDINADEFSLRPEEQQEAMRWLVKTVSSWTDTPLAIDSSNTDNIAAGLEAAADHPHRPMLNSASLERLDALDLAKSHNARAVITAAGESGMPQDADMRLDHASRMVEAALQRGLKEEDLFIDPLIFPISVDQEFGNHAFEAIRRLRERFGAAIHITGGFSNVSFGLPCRRLINDVFLRLAVEAGANSAILDPVVSPLKEVFALDREATPYRLAEDMLLGRDRMCKTFLRAYRKGELGA